MELYTSIYKGKPDCDENGKEHEWRYDADGFDIYTTDDGVNMVEDQKAYKCWCGATKVVCAPRPWVPNDNFMKILKDMVNGSD